MAMKDCSDEFKANAVALYESAPGATYKSIAADLGSTGTHCGIGCCGTANAAAPPGHSPGCRDCGPSRAGGAVRRLTEVFLPSVTCASLTLEGDR